MPIQKIKKEIIESAKAILTDIQEAINVDTNLSKEGLGGGNYAEKLKVME